MGFGLVLQESKEEKGKLEKIKTRSGDSIKLMELLNEATSRALAMFKERMALKGDKVQVEEKDLLSSAEILGMSAVKYYDLKQNRT
jgi:arginyl-tRNA synthetase